MPNLLVRSLIDTPFSDLRSAPVSICFVASSGTSFIVQVNDKTRIINGPAWGEQVNCGARFLDIALHDHIIIGDNRYYSFGEKEIMDGYCKELKET